VPKDNCGALKSASVITFAIKIRSDRVINQTVSACSVTQISWIQLNRNFGKFRGKRKACAWRFTRIAVTTVCVCLPAIRKMINDARHEVELSAHAAVARVAPSDPRHARSDVRVRFSDTSASYAVVPGNFFHFFAVLRRNDTS